MRELWASRARYMVGLKARRSLILALAVCSVGVCGMIAQLLLLRELLVVFLGNELSIGIILGNWLVLEAAGSYLGRFREHRHPLGPFLLAAILFAIALPLSLYAVRICKGLFGLPFGEGSSALHMLLFSALTLLPVSLPHGALFTIACRLHAWETLQPGSPARSAGRVYMLEVLGTAAGGLAFTFLLNPFFNSFQIGLGVCALNFLVCLPLSLLGEHSRPWGRGILGLLLAGLSGSVVLLACGGADALHWSSIRRQWSPLKVLYYENSPYGNITVTFRGGQYDFYSDGIPLITLPTPDIASAEELAHFPLLYHPDPREVLVIGRGAGGLLNEIAKHPVQRIEYAELDPLIFVALETFCPASLQAEWKTPLVSLQLTDGRRHLRRQASGKRFDLILIGLSQPGDLQTNRLFTLEFFHLCREHLNPGGIVAFSLPGSLTYLSQELKELNACLLKTLKRSFRYVQVLPGETNLFLASQEIDLAAIAAQSLRGELSSRGLKTSMVNPFYIDYRLRAERRLWLLHSLEDSGARLNRDFQPAAVFYSLGLWNAQFSPRLQKLFRRLGSLTLLPFLIASLAILAVLLAYRYFAWRPRTSPALVAAIHLTGLCGMMIDLAMVFAFQVFHGYLYQRLGILITAFMAGSGLGAAWISSRLNRLKKPLRLFLSLEAGLILFCLLLPSLFLHLFPALDRLGAFGILEGLFLLISLLGGALVGAEYPLAVRIRLQESASFEATVGLLNAADLAGGWWGGVLGAAALLPVLGMSGTFLALALLKGAGALGLFTYARGELQIRRG